MKFSILIVLALSLSLSAPTAQAGLPGFVPQPTEPVTTSMEYLLVNSGVLCRATPCPVYLAIAPGGEAIEVASVDLPASAQDSLVYDGTGISVTGSISFGDWQIGEQGNVLVVDEVLSASTTFLIEEPSAQCLVAPCPILSDVTGLNGASHLGVAINFDLLPYHFDIADVLGGNAAVHGFLVDFGTDQSVQKTLYITGKTPIFNAAVSRSGMICSTAPCPNWEIEESNGNQTLVTELRLPLLDNSEQTKPFAHHVQTVGTRAEGFIAKTQVRGYFLESLHSVTSAPSLDFVVTHIY